MHKLFLATNVAPTSGLKSCVHDFLIALFSFQGTLPHHQRFCLCVSQLIYNISSGFFCQELFKIFYNVIVQILPKAKYTNLRFNEGNDISHALYKAQGTRQLRTGGHRTPRYNPVISRYPARYRHPRCYRDNDVYITASERICQHFFLNYNP